MTSPPQSQPPVVWLLLDDRPGHRTQVLGLARSLAWPYEEKRLAFNRLSELPRWLMRRGVRSLSDGSRTLLAPPWPDVVIGMGRRIVPAARWIARQSGGRTKLVLIGRKVPSDSSVSDLTVACAHFGQIPHAGMFELVVPPTQVNAGTLETLRNNGADPMGAVARPHVLLLVGGPTSQHSFDAAFAAAMARDVAAAAAALGGGVAVVTSRRTPAAAIAAIGEAAPNAHIHEWQSERAHNPYLTYLAHADLIVVTGESESMLAEAIASGRPLTIYPLPTRAPSRKSRIYGRMADVARGAGPFSGIARALFAHAWITPPRDLSIMHRLIVEKGLGKMFDGRINRDQPMANDEGMQLARRISDMLAGVERRA